MCLWVSLIFYLIFHPQRDWRRHYNAENPDRAWREKILKLFSRYFISNSKPGPCDSSESSESQDSSDSSEEGPITTETTQVMTTTTGDASTLTPDTVSTGEPIGTETPAPATATPSVTSTGSVTEEISTLIPVTEGGRGDN